MTSSESEKKYKEQFLRFYLSK